MPAKKGLKANKLNKQTREDEAREQLAKELKLRPKTKAFVDLLQANPKLSQTEAYLMTHGTTNRDSARSTASTLLSKPSVRIYSNSAVNKAKKRIVSLIDSKQDAVALKASESVLDRQFGKSTQKSETVAKTVEVKLDLTGVRVGAHYIKAEGE